MSVVDEVTLALQRREAYDEVTYVPFQHVVVPSLLDPYAPRRPTYDEALVLRDPQQHLSLSRDEGAPGLVAVPCPSAEAPEFLAQAPPEYVKEMAEAMMGLEQLVRQYAMGHSPEVLPRTGGTMARGGASRGLRWKSVRFPAPQVSSASSREEPSSKRARHSAGTDDEPIDVSEDKTTEPTDVDLEATSGSTMPRATGTQEVSSSQAVEEVSEEDEDGEDDES
ncbi:hypothetical protein RHMOL_Rhmol04G0217500 [Rhododendron molle]|uniref:Uncharacterized protein n=1 Tax=Rhododendron molle TaxID=49168 RepID=A0ACC0P5H5_RHOML|nr:hypothetical protein RHMOL_Rhmol04G0217500 [Rhododendron molle]